MFSLFACFKQRIYPFHLKTLFLLVRYNSNCVFSNPVHRASGEGKRHAGVGRTNQRALHRATGKSGRVWPRVHFGKRTSTQRVRILLGEAVTNARRLAVHCGNIDPHALYRKSRV
jgi:hypothetical protein